MGELVQLGERGLERDLKRMLRDKKRSRVHAVSRTLPDLREGPGTAAESERLRLIETLTEAIDHLHGKKRKDAIKWFSSSDDAPGTNDHVTFTMVCEGLGLSRAKLIGEVFGSPSAARLSEVTRRVLFAVAR